MNEHALFDPHLLSLVRKYSHCVRGLYVSFGWGDAGTVEGVKFTRRTYPSFMYPLEFWFTTLYSLEDIPCSMTHFERYEDEGTEYEITVPQDATHLVIYHERIRGFDPGKSITYFAYASSHAELTPLYVLLASDLDWILHKTFSQVYEIFFREVSDVRSVIIGDELRIMYLLQPERPEKKKEKERRDARWRPMATSRVLSIAQLCSHLKKE